LQIRTLSLSGFRNLAEQSLEFTSGLNWVHGDNGQGKTNLLEAIHYLCVGKSQRRAPERELLGYNSDALTLEAVASKEGAPFEIHVGVDRRGQKRIRLAGRLLHRASDFLGTLNVVSLAPDDIAMVRGEPVIRRYFLDMLLSQLNRLYLRALQEYRQHLLQRNFLLRDKRPCDPTLLSTYTDKLVSLGAVLMRHRRQALSVLSDRAGRLFNELTERFGALDLRYHPGVELPVGVPDEEGLARAFSVSAEHERAVGATLVGPHRDDFETRLGARALRRFGSQGQCRAAAIALKLAAVDVVQSEAGRPPLLLLDDVFAELDEGLRRNLRRLLPGKSQIFIASPEMYFPLSSGARFHIEAGMLQRESA